MQRHLEGFTRYIASIKAESTARSYGVSVEAFLEWLRVQAFDLEHAPRTMLMSYCVWMSDRGYMPATVNIRMAALNRFLRYIEQRGVKIPDFYKPELPKNPKKIRDILEPDALSVFFRSADAELDEPVRSAVMLLPCTGLRGNELASLPLKGGLRRVSIRMANGSMAEVLAIVVKGKGGNERIAPLLNEGAQVVAGYLRGWRRTHANADWLFPGRGSHLTPRALRAALQRIREPLGLEFTPHTMRRTYLTGLYRRGVSAEVLMKIAGHKKLDTLLTHYLALDERDTVGAVHRVGATLIEEK